MTAVRGLLMTTRLLTLAGAGGSGKTRLALQVATDLLDEFEHGVWWVELSTLSAADLLAETVAEALGIQDRLTSRPQVEALAEYLAGRRLLLVLDTCEHLVNACAELVAGLLREAAKLVEKC